MATTKMIIKVDKNGQEWRWNKKMNGDVQTSHPWVWLVPIPIYFISIPSNQTHLISTVPIPHFH